MKLEPSQFRTDVQIVSVDANELDCGYKRLPYPTWIGTVNVRTGKIEVWTPAASVPRGYKAAARAALEKALEKARTSKGAA